MATITNLDTNLIARTKKFDGPIKKSKGVFGGFASSINSFSPAKFVAGAGLIIGAVGAFKLLSSVLSNVNEQFSKIDKIAKFADEVGASVSEIQALQLQAELTGSGQAALNKGIQRWNRVLGDARTGNAAAIKGFDQLGVSVQQFDGLSLTDQLALVSDQINTGATAADRASNAYAVFGRQGQELLTFFDAGGAGIRAAADDIDRFGGGLSRVDAAQVEIANDAFTRLNTLFDLVYQNIAVQVAPILTAFVEMFIDGASEAGGFGTIVETVFGFMVEGIAFAINGWNVLLGIGNAYRAYFVGLVGVILKGFGAIETALVKFGGQSFNFGINEFADDVLGVAGDFAEKAGQNFSDAFSGTAGADFKKRVAEIKARAKAIGEKPIEPKVIPKIEPPKIESGPGFFDQLAGFGKSVFDQVGGFISDFKLPEAEKKQRDQQLSVSGLAAGSSAALSLINRARQQGKGTGLDSTIKATSKRQIAEQRKTNKKLDKLTKKDVQIVQFVI